MHGRECQPVLLVVRFYYQRFAELDYFDYCFKNCHPNVRIGRNLFCAEQRIDREGSSPSSARMRSAVSKSGSNASLAGESGRYDDV